MMAVEPEFASRQPTSIRSWSRCFSSPAKALRGVVAALAASTDQRGRLEIRCISTARPKTPVIALGAAAREALRLADVLETMLQGVRDAFRNLTGVRSARQTPLDDVLPEHRHQVISYLAQSGGNERCGVARLAFATNMEQAGDIMNLLGVATRQLKRGLKPPRRGRGSCWP